MKLIIIPNLPYTYRDHIRFGTKFFLEKGFFVEVWDPHKFLIPNYKEKVNIDYFMGYFYYELNDIDELFKKLSQLSQEDYILFNFGKSRIDFLKILKEKTNAKFIIHAAGAFPLEGLTINVPQENLNEKYFPVDVLFLGSNKDKLLYKNFIQENTKIIKANSRDYDLNLEENPYISEEKYVVYIDTDAIDSSDYLLSNKVIKINSNSYYTKLLNFFIYIEKIFSYKIIIAAHPKSRKFKNVNSFKGFKVISNKTCNLIKSCEFIINEGSAAISYAILNNKPILFITMSELNFFIHTNSFAKELEKEIINIDSLNSLNKISIENNLNNCKKYNYYKFNYITCEEKKQSTFEIMVNYFKANIINN